MSNLWTLPLDELKRRMEAEAVAPSLPPEVREIEARWDAFRQLCPDYADTPQNAEVLVRYLSESADVFPTAEQLRSAHAQAWRAGEYASAARQPDTDPMTMPMDDLRRLVTGQPDPLPEMSMDLEELRDLAFGINRPQPDPAWTMPLAELRATMEATADAPESEGDGNG